MSEQHTQGKMMVQPVGKSFQLYRYGYGGVFLHSEEYARRLAACWNFCEGLPTNNIEGKLAAEAIGLALEAGDAIADELAESRAMLESVAQHQSVSAQLSQRIRAFLNGGK